MAENLGNLFIDGEGIIEDETGTHTIINNNGVTLDTDVKRFGESSMYFPTGDYLTIPAHSDFDLSDYTGSWTIDFWTNNSNLSTLGAIVIGDESFYCLLIGMLNGKQCIIGSYDGGSWNILEYGAVITNNVWQHHAYINIGGDVKIYLDGVETGSFTLTSDITFDTYNVKIGAHYNNDPSWYLDGYLDNFRLVKGEALWTSGFDVDDNNAMFYSEITEENPYIRPDSITGLYNLSHRGNLRGQASEGWVRPTISQFFTSKEFYKTPSNQPPIANPDSVELTENTNIIIDLLANDTDPELQPLTVTALAGVAHGSLEDHGDGTVTYTPVVDYFGEDSFGYTITDNVGNTADSVCSITISEDTSPSDYTEDKCVGGVATSDSVNGLWNSVASQAFDNDDFTIWSPNNSLGWPHWIQYKFSSPKTIVKYSTKSTNSNFTSMMMDWQFQGSLDGVIWVTLDTRSNELFDEATQYKTFEFSNDTAYEYYRWNITSNAIPVLFLIVNELEMFEGIYE